MAKAIKVPKAKQTIFHGWGFVEGRWVYVPLWDPSPIDKFAGYKLLHLANGVNNIASFVSSEKVVTQLKTITRELLGQVSKASLSSWEEGDGICPEWWPWPKGPNGPIGPVLENPIYFPSDLSKKLTDQIAGHLLSSLGNAAKHSGLQKIGKELLG